MPLFWEWGVSATRAVDSTWEALHAQATDISYIIVYLVEFTGIVESGPPERQHITRHIFYAPNEIFCQKKQECHFPRSIDIYK